MSDAKGIHAHGDPEWTPAERAQVDQNIATATQLLDALIADQVQHFEWHRANCIPANVTCGSLKALEFYETANEDVATAVLQLAVFRMAKDRMSDGGGGADE